MIIDECNLTVVIYASNDDDINKHGISEVLSQYPVNVFIVINDVSTPIIDLYVANEVIKIISSEEVQFLEGNIKTFDLMKMKSIKVKITNKLNAIK